MATDDLGNVGRDEISGVTHDASRPVISSWFPKNSLLPEDQINDKTPPVFTLTEDVDSVAVVYASGSGDVTVSSSGATKGEHTFDFAGKLKQDVSYTMTILARDLAGNVFVTHPDSSKNLRFNSEFANPTANQYKITTETDSVIAGQANILTIQAQDHNATSNTTRNALTYKNRARIKAMDAAGNAVASVSFDGAGVTDNAGGMAMLSLADWSIGKRTVEVKSNKAVDYVKVMVEHLNAGQDGTDVVAFGDAIDSLYVGVADFAGFAITAMDNDEEGVNQVWGDFSLKVVPVDRHGNPSLRAFKADPKTAEDSLAVLDTRVKDKGYKYDDVEVRLQATPSVSDLPPEVWGVSVDGTNWLSVTAPAKRDKSLVIQARVVNSSITSENSDDKRSQNTKGQVTLTIAPYASDSMLSLAASAESVTIAPGKDSASATVTASGNFEGTSVSFTVDAGDSEDVDTFAERQCLDGDCFRLCYCVGYGFGWRRLRRTCDHYF